MHEQVNILPFANEQSYEQLSAGSAYSREHWNQRLPGSVLSSSTPEAWEIKQAVHTFYPKTTLDIGGVFLCVLFLHLVKA